MSKRTRAVPVDTIPDSYGSSVCLSRCRSPRTYESAIMMDTMTTTARKYTPNGQSAVVSADGDVIMKRITQEGGKSSRHFITVLIERETSGP